MYCGLLCVLNCNRSLGTVPLNMPWEQHSPRIVWNPLPYRTWNNEIPATLLYNSLWCTWDRLFRTLLECAWCRSPRADQAQSAWTGSWSLFFPCVLMQGGSDCCLWALSWQFSGSPLCLDSSVLPILSCIRMLAFLLQSPWSFILWKVEPLDMHLNRPVIISWLHEGHMIFQVFKNYHLELHWAFF